MFSMDDYDPIAVRLEHEAFMDELRELAEKVFWEFQDKPVQTVVDAINDLDRYGDEAVFTDILFDRILKEAIK